MVATIELEYPAERDDNDDDASRPTLRLIIYMTSTTVKMLTIFATATMMIATIAELMMIATLLTTSKLIAVVLLTMMTKTTMTTALTH